MSMTITYAMGEGGLLPINQRGKNPKDMKNVKIQREKKRIK